ncbi:hypothetical protein J6590_024052 [Homalodisca vitripennis]|nr:hypothetical protein J6590_024052 [Homalodisca vitripennis]
MEKLNNCCKPSSYLGAAETDSANNGRSAAIKILKRLKSFYILTVVSIFVIETGEVHSHNTQHANDFSLPTHRRTFTSRNYSSVGQDSSMLLENLKMCGSKNLKKTDEFADKYYKL